MTNRKMQIDALLLKLAGVTAGSVSGLDAYFIGGRMFACICADGVALRLPVAVSTDLQFSRADVVPFTPRGVQSSREWIQINRADPGDYVRDLDLFQASVEFVKTSRGR